MPSVQLPHERPAQLEIQSAQESSSSAPMRRTPSALPCSRPPVEAPAAATVVPNAAATVTATSATTFPRRRSVCFTPALPDAGVRPRLSCNLVQPNGVPVPFCRLSAIGGATLSGMSLLDQGATLSARITVV